MERIESSSRGTSSTALTLAVIAALLSVGALTLAWAAYNRAGEDLEDQVANTASSAAQQVAETADQFGRSAAQVAARAEARARLVTIRAQLETDQNYAEAEKSIAAVRTDLAKAYDKSEGATAQEWERLNTSFDSLESNVRSGTASALTSLSGMIDSLASNVSTDN